MGPNYSGSHVLPEVLERIGMSARGDRAQGLRALLPMPRWGAWKTRAIERLVSPRVIEGLKAIVPASVWDPWTRRILHAGSGWEKSRAFCVPNDHTGAIRINLEGREPNGTVAPGAEYQVMCDAIRSALLELRHIETGRPVVRDVIQTNRVYEGEHLAELPDLIVTWTSDAMVTGVRSDRVGSIALPFPERRTGAHGPSGALIAAGPQIRKGARPARVTLPDFAPTILALLDDRSSHRYGGAVISELIDR
jgi:predicted AlkP superfamily phosphohydrolase/phosphomutase